jgi:hypothetical protein
MVHVSLNSLGKVWTMLLHLHFLTNNFNRPHSDWNTLLKVSKAITSLWILLPLGKVPFRCFLWVMMWSHCLLILTTLLPILLWNYQNNDLFVTNVSA